MSIAEYRRAGAAKVLDLIDKEYPQKAPHKRPARVSDFGRERITQMGVRFTIPGEA